MDQVNSGAWIGLLHPGVEVLRVCPSVVFDIGGVTRHFRILTREFGDDHYVVNDTVGTSLFLRTVQVIDDQVAKLCFWYIVLRPRQFFDCRNGRLIDEVILQVVCNSGGTRRLVRSELGI